MNFDEVIKRTQEVFGFDSDKQLAELFEISQQNFSNRKRKGTLLPKIVRAVSKLHPEVNLDWVLRGRGSKVFSPNQATLPPRENGEERRKTVCNLRLGILDLFEDKEKIRAFVLDLRELERLDPSHYDEFRGDVRGMLRVLKGEKTASQT